MNEKVDGEKRLMRAHMKAVIEAANEKVRAVWSAEIAKHVTALAEWKASSTLLAFLPMTGEVDTTGIIAGSLKAGKIVGVPRMYGMDIKFHRIDSLDGPWDLHPYGLREPPVSLPIIDPCSPDAGDTCVITPGLCFDNRGNRLGFGRGYYDRFIASCKQVKTREIFFAAVCFNIQLVETVPTDEHDSVLDGIVTETGPAWRRRPDES